MLIRVQYSRSLPRKRWRIKHYKAAESAGSIGVQGQTRGSAPLWSVMAGATPGVRPLCAQCQKRHLTSLGGAKNLRPLRRRTLHLLPRCAMDVVSSQTTRSNSNPKASICTKHNARAVPSWLLCGKDGLLQLLILLLFQLHVGVQEATTLRHRIQQSGRVHADG